MCQERLHNQVDVPNLTDWYNTGEFVVCMWSLTVVESNRSQVCGSFDPLPRAALFLLIFRAGREPSTLI